MVELSPSSAQASDIGCLHSLILLYGQYISMLSIYFVPVNKNYLYSRTGQQTKIKFPAGWRSQDVCGGGEPPGAGAGDAGGGGQVQEE